MRVPSVRTQRWSWFIESWTFTTFNQISMSPLLALVLSLRGHREVNVYCFERLLSDGFPWNLVQMFTPPSGWFGTTSFTFISVDDLPISPQSRLICYLLTDLLSPSTLRIPTKNRPTVYGSSSSVLRILCFSLILLIRNGKLWVFSFLVVILLLSLHIYRLNEEAVTRFQIYRFILPSCRVKWSVWPFRGYFNAT